MIRFPRPALCVAAIALITAAVSLSGCHSYDVKTQQQVDTMSAKFNTVVAAYKKDQFTLDGGVLSSADLGSHFAYLKDQGKLPAKVLLVPSEKSGIHKSHLAYMARMALMYGFKVYYDDDGVLTRLEATQSSAAKALKQSRPERKRKRGAQDQDPHDAANNGYSPAGGNRGY